MYPSSGFCHSHVPWFQRLLMTIGYQDSILRTILAVVVVVSTGSICQEPPKKGALETHLSIFLIRQPSGLGWWTEIRNEAPKREVVSSTPAAGSSRKVFHPWRQLQRCFPSEPVYFLWPFLQLGPIPSINENTLLFTFFCFAGFPGAEDIDPESRAGQSQFFCYFSLLLLSLCYAFS